MTASTNACVNGCKFPAGVCLCFAIIISYVMILAPARENLEEFLLRWTGWQSATAVATSRNVPPPYLINYPDQLPLSTTLINYLP